MLADSRETYKQLIRCLEQQLWFFGRDTLIRDNNLLEQYGFRRFRTPGHEGSNRYRISWGGRTVELHSFCVGIYGGNQDGFIYIRAFDKSYAYLGENPPLPGNYHNEQLLYPSDKESKQRFYKATCGFFEWLEDYEQWVETVHGKNYRLDCYQSYHRKWLEPDQAREWFLKYRSSDSNLKVCQAA